MSKRLFIIITLLCITVILAACGQTEETPSIPPPEDTSGIQGDVLVPDASHTTTSDPEPSAPQAEETESSPTAADSTSKNSTTKNSATETPNSTPATPPSSNAPSQPPAQSSTPTPTPPTSSVPATPTPDTPTTPTYTEADYQRIIDTIRAYGEAKGFVWNDSFAFGQDGLGYYGRPNLERDGYDGVINRLKYHCDEMKNDIGACHFKVVKNIYQGNTEFVVLYG